MDPELSYMSTARLNFVARNVPDVNLSDLPADERKCLIYWKPYVQEKPRVPYSQRTEEGAGMLQCGHVFGQHCLEDWIIAERRNTCPLCRTVIYEGSPDSEYDSEDDANEPSGLQFGEFRVDLGTTTGFLSDDDGETGEGEIGGDGQDREGGVGSDRMDGGGARGQEAEQEGIEPTTQSQSDDEEYGQWSENNEEAEYPISGGGLEKGQRTIDEYFGPLNHPLMGARRET